MDLFLTLIVYPVILLLLSLGTGMLIERVGVELPGRLVAPVGFAGLIVISQFLTLRAAVAPWTPAGLVGAALIGFIAGRRRLLTWLRQPVRQSLAVITPALAAYLTMAIVVLAAGRLTFPGYLLDTTGSFHISAGAWMLHHGQVFPTGPPAYGTMLNDYFGIGGEPVGGQGLLGSSGWLTGQSLIWLYFPFQAFALSMCASVLAFLARRSGEGPLLSGVIGWIAAVPALTYSYALMGSIKELSALPAILFMGALISLAPELRRSGLRSFLPFAVAGGAAFGAIGPSSVAWLGTFGLLYLAASVPTLSGSTASLRRLARIRLWSAAAGGAALLVLVGILAAPALSNASRSFTLAAHLSSSNAGFANDPGNLLRPLRLLQIMGIWLGYDHRQPPRYPLATNVLIGFSLACFALGVISLLRKRRWSILVFAAGMLVVLGALYLRGTEWTDAKVLAMSSPVVVFVSLLGARRAFGARFRLGWILLLVAGGGILASDALAYHGTNLAPTVRFVELQRIGRLFAGEGPALLPDFDEYAMFALRSLQPDSPGYAPDMNGGLVLAGGQGPAYGISYDIDALPLSEVEHFRLIVMRHSPLWSRPPSNYHLIWSGRYYEVWRQAGQAPLEHVALGTPATAPSCRVVAALAREARQKDVLLIAALREPEPALDLGTAYHSAGAVLLPGQFVFVTPATISGPLVVSRSGSYALWLEAETDRALEIYLDGRRVGAVGADSGGNGNAILVGRLALRRGVHVVRVVRRGGSLAPGDGAVESLSAVILQRFGTTGEPLVGSSPGRFRALCGASLDWLELVRR